MVVYEAGKWLRGGWRDAGCWPLQWGRWLVSPWRRDMPSVMAKWWWWQHNHAPRPLFPLSSPMTVVITSWNRFIHVAGKRSGTRWETIRQLSIHSMSWMGFGQDFASLFVCLFVCLNLLFLLFGIFQIQTPQWFDPSYMNDTSHQHQVPTVIMPLDDGVVGECSSNASMDHWGSRWVQSRVLPLPPFLPQDEMYSIWPPDPCVRRPVLILHWLSTNLVLTKESMINGKNWRHRAEWEHTEGSLALAWVCHLWTHRNVNRISINSLALFSVISLWSSFKMPSKETRVKVFGKLAWMWNATSLIYYDSHEMCLVLQIMFVMMVWDGMRLFLNLKPQIKLLMQCFINVNTIYYIITIILYNYIICPTSLSQQLLLLRTMT